MAKRIYIRRSSPSATSNHIITQLENEGNRLIAEMRNQFAKELMQALDLAGSARNGSGGAANSEGADVSSFLTLFSTAAKYLFRPQAKVTSQETSRSVATQQKFRLSQSQAAAEANAALIKAQKNM